MARDRGGEEPKKAPAWLSSYGDMITNLMTFFVLLVTFSSKSEGEFRQFKGGLFSGPLEGLGLLLSASGPEDNFRSDVLEREATAEGRNPHIGSRMPPRYQEELLESAATLHSLLSAAEPDENVGAMTLRLPTDALLKDGELTPAAHQLLDSLATVFNRLPYDIQFLGSSDVDARAAVRLAHGLQQRMGSTAWVSAGVYPGASDPGTIVLAVTANLGRVLDRATPDAD